MLLRSGAKVSTDVCSSAKIYKQLSIQESSRSRSCFMLHKPEGFLQFSIDGIPQITGAIMILDLKRLTIFVIAE